MPFTIIRQDITKMKVDAIVNAANTGLIMGGGVCGAIFRAAGADKMTEACRKLAPIKTGEAVITPGFDLSAKYVIHTAGPIYDSSNSKECERLLYSSYSESLKLAEKNDCTSIAFPMISSGIYGYPKSEAFKVATTAIRDFLNESDMDVYLAVFDRTALMVSKQLIGDVKSYISQHYVDEHDDYKERLRAAKCQPQSAESSMLHFVRMPDETKDTDKVKPALSYEFDAWGSSTEETALNEIDKIMVKLDEPFADALFGLIDSKGMSDTEVYKKANIDRKLFSKIRSIKGYTPKKPTILALAIALGLSLDETDALLERAGYALSHASKFDVIVEYFIINGPHDIFFINQVLFNYNQPLLGA